MIVTVVFEVDDVPELLVGIVDFRKDVKKRYLEYKRREPYPEQPFEQNKFTGGDCWGSYDVTVEIP